MGANAPQKMTVLIPKADRNGKPSEWKPQKKDDHLYKSFRRGCISRITALNNKMPAWNASIKAYVLNFNGRVTMPSVKNFQLMNPNASYIFL